MFLLIGFLVIRDATILNDLKNEVNELAKLDITKDRYNRDIKSRGNYAIVEKAIKKYLDDYAVELQGILTVMKDEQLTKILSYENYSKDGPSFVNSLSYLSTTRREFNKSIEDLIDDLEEGNIEKYIRNTINDPYYISLYKEFILSEDMKNEFNETKNLLEKTKISVNNVFDVSTEVLNFLITNKDSWSVEDGEIKFVNVDLYNYYNALISKLQVNWYDCML